MQKEGYLSHTVKIACSFAVPGGLSWLSLWLQLRSWSPGLWIWAPHLALCCQPFQHRARLWPSVPFSLCPSPTYCLLKVNKHLKITCNFRKSVAPWTNAYKTHLTPENAKLSCNPGSSDIFKKANYSFFLFLNIYLFILRERQRERAGGAERERERERENPKQLPRSS